MVVIISIKEKKLKIYYAYLKFISNHNDDVSLERVINVPKRGIGDTTIDNIRAKANENNISMFDALTKGKELEFKNVILSLIEDE